MSSKMPQNGFQQRDNNGHKFFVKFCKVFLKFLQNQKKKKNSKTDIKRWNRFQETEEIDIDIYCIDIDKD